MASLPYMQLYVADYLADTMHLTVEQHGAYLLLIMNYWQTGKPLPDNDQRLQCICKASAEQWQELRPALEEFFIIQGGYWYHNRIEDDLEKVRAKSESARKAAQKRHKPAPGERSQCERNADAEQTDVRTPSHTDTDTDTEQDTDKETDSSSPPGDSPDEPLPARQFPLKDGTFFEPEESYVDELKAAHPQLSVEYELRRARLWLISNPGKRKTEKGMKRFLTSWMGRQQAPTGNIHPIRSRHTGFDQKDYSAGLIKEAPDGAANF